MARKIRVATLAALLTAIGAGELNAATLTKNVECFRGTCPSVTGFDASLGRLQSVSFEGSVRDDAAFQLFNFSEEPINTVLKVSSDFQFLVSKSGSSIALTGSNVEATPVTFAPFESAIIIPTGTANLSGQTRDVAGFIGPDLISFDLQSQIRVTADQLSITPEFIRRLGQGYFGTLTFEYAAVPEPASWMLLIGGFGACGAVLRRQRRAMTAAPLT